MRSQTISYFPCNEAEERHNLCITLVSVIRDIMTTYHTRHATQKAEHSCRRVRKYVFLVIGLHDTPRLPSHEYDRHEQCGVSRTSVPNAHEPMKSRPANATRNRKSYVNASPVLALQMGNIRPA